MKPRSLWHMSDAGNHGGDPHGQSFPHLAATRAVRIPVEFDLPGNEVTIRKEGSTPIIETATCRR